MITPATRIGPGLLVLDFDGVVCDGMEEFFESSWRAWQSLKLQELPAARRSEAAWPVRAAPARRGSPAGRWCC
jgi:hypothetical protein